MNNWISKPSLLLAFLIMHYCAMSQAKSFRMLMRTRNAVTNELITTPQDVDASQVAIIIIDSWNYHWCMTWTQQVGGMSPRMNRALECARKLGITVLWAPTDVAAMYSGWPQRQRALAVPYIDVPHARDYSCKFTIPFGECLCGPGIECRLNYGHDGMDPQLKIDSSDLIVCGTKELYSICKARNFTHLIYFGGATNICITEKPEGLNFMYGAGLQTIFARDLAFAWSGYYPLKSFTPTTGNEQASDDLKRAGIPTISFINELQRQAVWNNSWITEPVRITPAGTVNRPYFFDSTVTVTLETPFLEKSVIRYTLDGSEPAASSPRYQLPFIISKQTTIRTAAFRGTKKISVDEDGFFVKLPAVPPQPDTSLSTIEPVEDLYSAISPVYAACLWKPVADKSFEQKTLRIRERKFQTGMGMRAPSYMRINLKTEWKRFVALAGVDDNMLEVDYGRNISMYPKIKFRIFIDGLPAAESPVMRISQEPWRFNVPIPPGSRQLVIVCDDTGEKSPYNLGNLVKAGFCFK